LSALALLATTAGVSRPGVAQSSACQSESAAAHLDHVAIAVRDLASASSLFRDTLGFSLKPGSLHGNGLSNVHVRFADGSALELITAGQGEPDGLSEWYRRFLVDGDGGAFLALRAGPPDSVLDRLGELAAEALIFEGPAFDWVSFPEGHPLHPIFFVHVREHPVDMPGHLRHANGATGLSEVWLESLDLRILAVLLGRFGAKPCGEVEGIQGLSGIGYGLAGSTLVAVPMETAEKEPRVPAVILRGDRRLPNVRSTGVWMGWVEGP
jgi:catechol 2,3-dioxygenase-like lactoylglutathione lyase family enzyme